MSIAEASHFLEISRHGVHKRLKSKNINLPKEGRTFYINHACAKELFNLKFKTKIISMQIVKGGTGKTTLVQSIATRASLYGARVLCIDLDQQANLTLSFNKLKESEKTPVMVDIIEDSLDIKESILSIVDGLDIIPSRMDNASLDNALLLKKCRLDKVYKRILEPLKKQYDLILFDCPPSIGQSVSAATLASDYIIAPVTPSEFSISGLKISIKEINSIESDFEKKIDIRILLNMHDSRKKTSFEVLENLVSKKAYKNKLFKSYIRINQAFENVIKDRITIYEKLKWTPEKEDVDLITKEILGIN